MMTPRQKRIHQDAMEKIAAAPRKSWLGKFRPLTSVQSAWVKSLLTVWGESYGGRISEEVAFSGVSFWRCIRSEEWSDNQAKRITETLKELHKAGYRGVELQRLAMAIIWPQRSLKDLISKTSGKEDGDFVEKCILNSLRPHDPVYIIGLSFYARRKRTSEIALQLQNIAPWLTRKQTEDRVRWCVSHFNCAVYHAIKKEMVLDDKNT